MALDDALNVIKHYVHTGRAVQTLYSTLNFQKQSLGMNLSQSPTVQAEENHRTVETIEAASSLFTKFKDGATWETLNEEWLKEWEGSVKATLGDLASFNG